MSGRDGRSIGVLSVSLTRRGGTWELWVSITPPASDKSPAGPGESEPRPAEVYTLPRK